jgi:hypothetical protein
MMKKTRFLVVILVLTVALSLLTVSLAAAGGHQQSGSSDEISADQAGNFPLVTTGTGGGLACPAGTVETTLYFNDFEVDDGGWVESGQGEWERGSITTGVHEFCDTTPRPEPSGPWSGSNVWATNLDGCYQNSGAQSFLSQSFDLSAIPAPIQLSWWNWHEVFGTFDVIRVNVNAATMWEDTSSGATADWISETVDLSSYAGNAAVNVEYDLDVTTVVNRSGWYLDDIAISYCAPLAPPSIAMTKTVGTDPNTCSSTSVIGVNEGDDVYYCYEVRNTGDITLTLHDLDDDQLGPLLSAFPYGLGPGQSVDTVNDGRRTPNHDRERFEHSTLAPRWWHGEGALVSRGGDTRLDLVGERLNRGAGGGSAGSRGLHRRRRPGDHHEHVRHCAGAVRLSRNRRPL